MLGNMHVNMLGNMHVNLLGNMLGNIHVNMLGYMLGNMLGVGVPRQDRNNPKLNVHKCLLTIKSIDKQMKARIYSHSEMHGNYYFAQ